jgi:hypothetical protein
MTAPAAPRIYANQDGTRIYVRWRPVDTATDYNLYVTDAGGPEGIEAQFDDVDINPDGWFFYISAPNAGIVNVRLTALNIGAEESAFSNSIQKNLMGGGYNGPWTDALGHQRHGLAE